MNKHRITAHLNRLSGFTYFVCECSPWTSLSKRQSRRHLKFIKAAEEMNNGQD